MASQNHFHFEIRKKYDPTNAYSKIQARANLRGAAMDWLFGIIHPQQWYGVLLQVNNLPPVSGQRTLELIGDVVKLADPGETTQPPTPADFDTRELWAELWRRMRARVWHPKPKPTIGPKTPML